MATHTDIKTMQDIALHYGGKCLSKEYIDEHSLLEWRCEKGHRWESSYKVVNQGGWCVQCWKKKKEKEEHFNDLIQQAVKKGGRCISSEYVSYKTKLEFECAEGHRWMTAYSEIMRGRWCKKCGYKQNGINSRESIDVYQKLAEERGGKLLSDTYSGNNVKLHWQCSEGHQWYANGEKIKIRKQWCPLCSKNRRLTLEDMKKDAAANGGECLSQKFINSITKLKWKCAEGHTWTATPNDIRSGKWCKICAFKRIGDAKRDSIETFHAIAKQHGGKCLSTEYTNQKTKLEFECVKGHKWKAAGLSVKNNGTWCELCSYQKRGQKRKHPIELFQNIAKERGGICLTEIYTNNHKNMKWECAEGHQWQASGGSIIQGTWCGRCDAKRRGLLAKDTLDTYHKIAFSHDGKCLSGEYKNSNTKLEFECANGHRWMMRPHSIKKGGWCKICKAEEKKKKKLETK